MNLRKALIIFSPLLFLCFSNDKFPTASFDTASSHLKLGNVSINKNSKISEFVAAYGEPKKKKTDKQGSLNYYYEDYGILLSTQDGLIKGVGITFNSDGDSNFTMKAYTGAMQFGTISINSQSKQEDLKTLSDFFICPMPLMCASKNKEASIRVIAGFEKAGEKRITQLAFLIN